MKATATELNKHPGKYINQAIKEPVIIERSGHPVAVMVSYERDSLSSHTKQILENNHFNRENELVTILVVKP